MDDPELDELFKDPAHHEVVELLKASRPATPPLDPNFRLHLRSQLMAEARATLPRREPRPWFRFSPRTMAPAMAAVAAGFIIVLGLQVYLRNQPPSNQVAVDVSQIANKTEVSTGEPIRIPFSGPVNKTAVQESVVIEPATAVTKHWEGQTLVITPDHPLAPNTTYTVRLKPDAAASPSASPSATPQVAQATPKAAVAPTPLVVHFTTVRAPAPPAVPPSFKSANVSYGHDSRLSDSGSILGASWTPSGQLLVTRPAGAGPLASGSPNSGPSASPSTAAGTDVWLMSPTGKPVRLVAPGGNLPAAAPSGGMFAVWRSNGAQSNLEIRDLQGNLVATVASVDQAPDRAAVWLAAERVAYLKQGVLRIVDLHGNQVDTPALKVEQGSLAVSADGVKLAAAAADGAVVVDLSSAGGRVRLPQGAFGFVWSPNGALAFLVQQSGGTDLYVATDGKAARKVASSSPGQSWSDLSWAPDATSLMLAAKPAGVGTQASRLLLINADGSAATPFAAAQLEYSRPQWSSRGDLVLFTRQDEAGGQAFWIATTAPSDTDAAEKQALAEVDKFMQARIRGDSGATQDALSPAGRRAYQAGASTLLSPAGLQFDRYYPVSVQVTGPKTFLVGVRLFLARSGIEISFFEEELTLVLTDQRYLIDAVKASPTLQLGHGPSVLSVQVAQIPPGQQVRVRFDADLKPATITNGTIQVRDADGNPVSARVTFDPDNHLVSLSVKLKPGTYRLVVTTGVSDINGAALAQQYDAPLVIGR
jgi:Big-like domain-containing protein